MSEEEVQVLYDYSYAVDDGLVEIRVGDVFKLVERTNDEWWQVRHPHDDPNDSEDGFFVPAQYVRVRKAQNIDDIESAISSLDKVLSEEETNETEASSEHVNSQDPTNEDASDESKTLTKRGVSPLPKENGENSCKDDDRMYMNLDKFRKVASLPQLISTDSSSTNKRNGDLESDYANLPFQQALQSSDQAPRLADGHFVRVLIDHLPWDIYEDHKQRRFFHNRETGELTWKPPRKDKPLSPTEGTPTTFSQNNLQLPLSQPSSNRSHSEEVDIRHPPHEQVDQFEDVFYVNKSTQEKGSDLKLRSDSNQEGSVGLLSTSQILRQSKSKSMYEKIDIGVDVGAPKACTLPPNMSLGSGEQFSGYLNKAKIAEVGKKKMKKSWSQTYAVLQASNLVFYKDQKSAIHKPGSPHGKPEGFISLLAAKIDFNPAKDITSRRNTILVTARTGNQILLHSDDDKVIHDWLFRLKLVSNDIRQDSSAPDQDSRPGCMVRSYSTDDNASAITERNRNMPGIRAKLLNLISRRPTQEDLVKRGIFKDAVFGSSLQDLCERDKSPVPNFVLECISAVEAKGLEHDGLYRISGNLAEIQRLRYAIDKDDCHDLSEEQWDIHVLTGALKLFFRELKEPLFPFKSFDKFMEAVKKESKKDKMKAFKDTLSSLPKCNYETIRVLFQHLTNVIKFSQENRMQTQNVAIVFGPTLMWAEGDFSRMAILTLYQSKVVEFMLLEYDQLLK